MTSIFAVSLTPLILLACPIGMGLMMFFMARGMRGDRSAKKSSRLATIDELRVEQARLAGEIEQLQPREGDGAGQPVNGARA